MNGRPETQLSDVFNQHCRLMGFCSVTPARSKSLEETLLRLNFPERGEQPWGGIYPCRSLFAGRIKRLWRAFPISSIAKCCGTTGAEKCPRCRPQGCKSILRGAAVLRSEGEAGGTRGERQISETTMKEVLKEVSKRSPEGLREKREDETRPERSNKIS